MRNSLLLVCYIVSLTVFGQIETKRLSNVPVDKHWKINFSEKSTQLELSRLKNLEAAPMPIMRSKKVKAIIDSQRKRTLVKSKSSYLNSPEELTPNIESSFNGKPIGMAGIPNDNTMAISNDGFIVSAINTTVTILNEKGERLGFKSLYGMTAGQLGLLDRYYDPKVIYDPLSDRFILVFLEGSTSADTRIVVGFTETNDPTQSWNFYALNGKPLGGKTWSDYPIIAHNKTDLYITVNLLRDNESWQEGFVESFIWQVNKQDGYDGNEDLRQNLFSGINYNNKPVWSICPVQPGIDFDQENMYFLSVRPDALSNDTLFLHEITNSTIAGNAQHKLSVLTTDLPYGVPPTAYQPVVGYRLQTNDTRVLSAVYHDNTIHYVQSSILTDEIRSGIYHGIISSMNEMPQVNGTIISSNELDFAYPSIAFAGNTKLDNQSMVITFSHVGENEYAGTSAIYHNKSEGLESIYSNVVSIKSGDSLINTFVADTAERWGDYTDIQRKYNEPGVIWLCGSYGDSLGRNNVWLSKLSVKNDLIVEDKFLVYPNPVESSVEISINFMVDDQVTIQLVNNLGSVVKEITNEPVRKGNARFLLNTEDLSSGVYILALYDRSGQKINSQKIIVN
ncbi:MAG: T9SS type A sorting domain-containing protein [Bacteroidia bacterium]|nr:T9SS type A sorting domain-containing protein [Bacteroidia bacterium]